MTINTGWWPTPPHLCIRCGKPTESALYLLCEECHQRDAEEEWEEQQEYLDRLEADRQREIAYARYGW
jgi:hypothetical protein